MIEIRYVQVDDRDFWYRYDKHLPEQEFENNVKDKKGYILLEDYQSVCLDIIFFGIISHFVQ